MCKYDCSVLTGASKGVIIRLAFTRFTPGAPLFLCYLTAHINMFASPPFSCFALPSSVRMCGTWKKKGMSETKMLEIVKASDLKRAADLKILIESEVRAIKADLLAAYEEKVARLEAAMKAENAQVLANMANGLHYVVREVVSQVER